MPKFKITDSQTGKAVTVSGDSAPTDQEAEQIFHDAGLRTANPPSTIMDSLKGFGSGLLQNLAPFVGNSGPLQTNENDPQFNQTHLPAEEVAPLPGSNFQPQTTLGKYAKTAGEFAPAAFGGEASLPARILGRVLSPAIASEGAGQLTAGTAAEGPARIAGALVGGSPSAAVAGTRALGKTLAAKLAEKLPAEDASLVAKYESMGGNLRPGQYSPSNFIRQGDAVMADTPWPRVSGFSADSQHAILPAQQADQFNSLVSRTFGEDASRITDDVIQKARARIGKIYETVLPRNSVTADKELQDGLSAVEQNVAQAAPAMNSPDVVRIQNVLESIRRQVTEGSIPGKTYQSFRQRGGILDELAGSSSPVLQKAGTDIRHTLDDAFARQANEWDSSALKTARAQYRNLETIAPLAAKAPAGNISPGLLLGAVNKEFGSPGNADDLGTLARVGAAFLKAQPSSGTSERTVWRSLMNKPFSEGIPTAANKAFSLPISALATRTINKAINSPEMRAKMLADVLAPSASKSPQIQKYQAIADLLAKGN